MLEKLIQKKVKEFFTLIFKDDELLESGHDQYLGHIEEIYESYKG